MSRLNSTKLVFQITFKCKINYNYKFYFLYLKIKFWKLILTERQMI